VPVRRLTLIRHANAEWKNASIPDFDRPLNKRGLAEAEALAKILLEEKLVPDLLLASPARRTQQSSEAIVRKLELTAHRVKSVETLYLAPLEDILTLVHATGPKVQHLAIVGHNPGLSELAMHLAPETSDFAGLTTGAACSLTFTARAWTHLGPPAAHLAKFEPPAKSFSLFS
jgi:phosphohistidine phosphatase